MGKVRAVGWMLLRGWGYRTFGVLPPLVLLSDCKHMYTFIIEVLPVFGKFAAGEEGRKLKESGVK
jgi:hypothetical protein